MYFVALVKISRFLAWLCLLGQYYAHTIKRMAKRGKYSVVIPSDLKPHPSEREFSAACILSDYFQTNVVFILRSNTRTPDFSIDGVCWELKTPTGSGKYNIQHALKSALGQSANIIIDSRFSKIHINRFKSELHSQLLKTKAIRRLLLIDKSGAVVEIER